MFGSGAMMSGDVTHIARGYEMVSEQSLTPCIIKSSLLLESSEVALFTNYPPFVVLQLDLGRNLKMGME